MNRHGIVETAGVIELDTREKLIVPVAKAARIPAQLERRELVGGDALPAEKQLDAPRVPGAEPGTRIDSDDLFASHVGAVVEIDEVRRMIGAAEAGGDDRQPPRASKDPARWAGTEPSHHP